MARRLVLVLAALCAALMLASGAAAAQPRASATSIAVIVRPAGGDPVSLGYAEAPPNAGTNDGSLSADGVATGPAYTSVRTGPGALASALTTVRGVKLLDGAITAARVEASAEAVAKREEASGRLGGSRVEGLVVLGEPVEASPNRRVELADWGYAVLLEQAVVEDDAQGRSFRGFVTAIHVTLTADHAGLPAGSEILVGYAEAAAHMPAEAPPPAPSGGSSGGGNGDGGNGGNGGNGSGSRGNGGGRSGGSGSGPTIPREPDPLPPGATHSGPPPIVQNPPPDVRPQITGQGYVFPVYGPASFSDDFAAARASTGWHHGNDVFAPLGAPVLAVADGTLYSVGWNGVGGHRLWLRDRQGNEYYYAHLSAYSPLAVDGAQVEAGDVLGFVGTSGDAQGTPPHLHFEIHPAALLGLGYDGVVNPYAYLLAWQADADTSFVAETMAETAPKPAAAVIAGQDISAASGLVPGALGAAWEAPLVLGEIVGLSLPVVRPALVGIEPGFIG